MTHRRSLNIRGAFLAVLSDLLGTLAVVVFAEAIALTADRSEAETRPSG
jgi:Co/Zn/Cd efflux system component